MYKILWLWGKRIYIIKSWNLPSHIVNAVNESTTVCINSEMSSRGFVLSKGKIFFKLQFNFFINTLEGSSKLRMDNIEQNIRELLTKTNPSVTILSSKLYIGFELVIQKFLVWWVRNKYCWDRSNFVHIVVRLEVRSLSTNFPRPPNWEQLLNSKLVRLQGWRLL